MSAAAMLDDLRRRGVRLEGVGDRIKLDSPPGALRPDEVAALAARKAELLAALSGEDAEADAADAAPPTDDEWTAGMRASFALVLHLPPAGCLGPRVCARIGPCERHVAGRPCEVAS